MHDTRFGGGTRGGPKEQPTEKTLPSGDRTVGLAQRILNRLIFDDFAIKHSLTGSRAAALYGARPDDFCLANWSSSHGDDEPEVRVPNPTPKRTIYTEAMEVFHRAADLIGLDRRVRLELEEPDYEHIFYVTVKLHSGWSRSPPSRRKEFADLGDTQVPPGRARAAPRRQLRLQAARAARRRRADPATATCA